MAGTFANDTGAYFTGRTLGRHKLAPDLSPGKTVDGTIVWGDGGSSGNGSAGLTCAPDAPLVPVRNEYPVTTFYEAPGTYTVTYEFAACPPAKPVTGSFTVTVG